MASPVVAPRQNPHSGFHECCKYMTSLGDGMEMQNHLELKLCRTHILVLIEIAGPAVPWSLGTGCEDEDTVKIEVQRFDCFPQSQNDRTQTRSILMKTWLKMESVLEIMNGEQGLMRSQQG